MDNALNLHHFKRIAIIGNNGSGKSYLASQLALLLGHPLVHLDVLYWRRDWQAPTQEEWAAIQSKLVAREKWIIDGNHTSTMELRFQKAELVIFIDRNRLACLLGVIKRRGKRRPDMPDYLDDKLNRRYLRFLKGLWDFPKTRRRAIFALHQKYPQVAFCTLNSKRQMKTLIKNQPLT